MDEHATQLKSRIRRLRLASLLLLAIAFCAGVPLVFLWGRGGHAMFEDSGRTSTFLILLGLAAGACGIAAALLALRVNRLSDQLPRER
ncbi:MAG: hypothetical protein NTV21_20610 [Planctomycetota bacterium]|nr:hypothetical protein [Planctomycetota bacterium]